LPRLTLENLTKVFPGGVKALDGFALKMAEKEFLAVVGPSGCGKSTLLRMIAGLEEETSGRVLLDDRDLRGLAPRDRDMAIMFQNYALFPHMTVAENMAFGLKLRKVAEAERRERVNEIARTLGIGELLARYPSELSGGQRQRAALGRAILRRPKVFLFDEPLSNLDARMRAQMRVEISRLHQGIDSAMIFVTHDQVEAMTMGDRVAVLKDGVIQQVADPETLYARPANAFVASFIGSPGMNLFTGRIDGAGEDGALSFVSEAATLGLPADRRAKLSAFRGREVLLGLRPEDIGSAAARAEPRAPRLKGRVGVVERLGGQICLYLQCGSAAFAARPEGEAAWHAGQNADLPVDLAKSAFFDAATGLAIY
jgi:multiple sugar transport system ATP-binding protein